MEKFAFENLEVYQRSLDWVETVEFVCEQLKGEISRNFLDQFSRAAVSIPLNIAEGNGRWHKKDKRQFFWVARGSVFECVPLVQVLYRRELLNEAKYDACYEALQVMAKMLTNLVKSVEGMSRD